VRHVITGAAQVDEFDGIPGDFGRIAIGDAVAMLSRLTTQTARMTPP
jgi:chemotaxis protein CheY-P-specific phosphatase CheC